MSGKQTILITGANGYLGSHITELLKKSEHSVYALCLDWFDDMERWEKSGIKILRGDVTQPACFKLLEEYTFDTIIHLVSLNHFDSEKDPELALKVNVLPTWNLLKLFSEKGLKKFIYFSTQQVYGRLPAVNLDENFRANPVNSYGLTHLQSEQIVNRYNTVTDVEGINVRLSNSFGAPVFQQNSCWWLVVNDLCKTAWEEKKIKLLSDGSPQRDFIHVSDVAGAVKVLVENNNLSCNLFNISSGHTYTIVELALMIQGIFNERYKANIPIINAEGQAFKYDDKLTNKAKYTIQNSAITKAGLNIQTNIREGINSLFDYLEKH